MSDSELLASMYGEEEEDKALAAPAPSTSRTRTIRVGIIEYEVPTVEYMQFLEVTIAQQTRVLDQQRRAIERIQTLLQGMRGFVRRSAGALDDLRQNVTHRGDFQ